MVAISRLNSRFEASRRWIYNIHSIPREIKRANSSNLTLDSSVSVRWNLLRRRKREKANGEKKRNREESRRHLNAVNETRGIFIRILISTQISDDFPGNAISRSRRTIGRIEGPEGMKFRAKGFVHEMWLVRVQLF